jgi:L-lysine exporter family protein LysE/ArgO
VLNASLAGLLTGLSLIIAIGAQNAFVLRQGLRRDHVRPVVVVCTLSDYILIVAGIAGLGTVIRYAPWALLAVRWLGVAFLTWYGLRTAWHARHPSALHAAPANGSGPGPESRPRGPVIRRALAMTWLNPHVYLDTVLLLGSVANTHGPGGRWWFAVGAGVASTLWFTGLGFGARLLAPVLAKPRAWQVLDLLIAATMLVIAAELAIT